MTTIARAFVAVVPPPAVITGIEALVDSVQARDSPDDGLRWAPRRQWHLTLQFLGRLDESRSFAESLGESLRRIPPFPVQLGGGGAFPAAGRGSVLWLGVTTGRSELAGLAAAVAAVSEVEDDRPFRPHLTLARSSRPRDLSVLVAALGDGSAGPPWTVEDVVLFESDTRSTGAVHTARARGPLGPTG